MKSIVLAWLVLMVGCDSEKNVKLNFRTSKVFYSSNEQVSVKIENIGDKIAYLRECNGPSPDFYYQKKTESVWISNQHVCNALYGFSPYPLKPGESYGSFFVGDTGVYRLVLPFSSEKNRMDDSIVSNEFTIQ